MTESILVHFYSLRRLHQAEGLLAQQPRLGWLYRMLADPERNPYPSPASWYLGGDASWSPGASVVELLHGLRAGGAVFTFHSVGARKSMFHGACGGGMQVYHRDESLPYPGSYTSHIAPADAWTADEASKLWAIRDRIARDLDDKEWQVRDSVVGPGVLFEDYASKISEVCAVELHKSAQIRIVKHESHTGPLGATWFCAAWVRAAFDTFRGWDLATLSARQRVIQDLAVLGLLAHRTPREENASWRREAAEIAAYGVSSILGAVREPPESPLAAFGREQDYYAAHILLEVVAVTENRG